jgi:lysozyme
MRRNLGVVATLSAMLLMAAAAVYFYYAGYQPSAASFPVRGIDVSHHQNRIDWRRVANGNVRFAYIKATESTSYRDRSFAENWRAAKSAGLKSGAYHFISTVPNEAGRLAPALDLEFGGKCSLKPSSEKAKAEMAAFSDAILAVYGTRPVLYVTPSFLRAYGGVLPENDGLWVRSIAWSLPRWQSLWTFWQYHDRGQVDGIEGPVDLNVFNGTLQDFETKAPVSR